MKIGNSRKIRILLVFFCLFGVMGCNDPGTIPSSKAEEQKLIKELESQAGFVLLEDVELLEYMEDIARDGVKIIFLGGLPQQLQRCL